MRGLTARLTVVLRAAVLLGHHCCAYGVLGCGADTGRMLLDTAAQVHAKLAAPAARAVGGGARLMDVGLLVGLGSSLVIGLRRRHERCPHSSEAGGPPATARRHRDRQRGEGQQQGSEWMKRQQREAMSHAGACCGGCGCECVPQGHRRPWPALLRAAAGQTDGNIKRHVSEEGGSGSESGREESSSGPDGSTEAAEEAEGAEEGAAAGGMQGAHHTPLQLSGGRYHLLFATGLAVALEHGPELPRRWLKSVRECGVGVSESMCQWCVRVWNSASVANRCD